MERLVFECESRPNGAILRLLRNQMLRRAQPLPVEKWAERMADQAFAGVSRILSLLDDVDSPVERLEDGLFLDHATIAALTEPQALGLGLPPAVPFFLQVETKNLITDQDFFVAARWVGEANRPLRTSREGAFILAEGHKYRLPEPLFGLIEAIEAFVASDTTEQDVRMERLAHLQSLVPREARDQLHVDAYFSSFRVMQASAFSLSLKTSGRSFDFDPVLFGRRVVERLREESGGPVSQAEGLLTEHQQQIFANERFRSSTIVRPSYVIERGVYVHLDPSLREAMMIVRKMQSADPETRKRFAMAPQRHLKEALFEKLADDDVEKLFVETEQYSDRVVDIGLWTPPVLPWIKKEANDWLPEKFGLQIGSQYVTLKAEDIGPLRDQIQVAIRNSEPFIEFGNGKIRIPANSSTDSSLSSLLGVIKPAGETLTKSKDHDRLIDEENVFQKHVLIVAENFEGLGFVRQLSTRPETEASIPAAIRPTLKKHQQSGLSWLQDTWGRGYPGVLLADDMGLGKTLQALAFLAWLREGMEGGRKFGGRRGPILIVAPTGLLANWVKEHDLHLHEPGLGEVCRAYGRHLRILKVGDASDVDLGNLGLDHRRIHSADWVLTTYETLRDYHLSFAAIPFACVVFDEMQKVKSPAALLTRAAKAVNADYTIGLTGTPIENQLADLWCIMDIINPGRLVDLKSFSTKYKANDMGALEELRARLLDEMDGNPPPVLRRMKADHLEGLPEKILHIRKRKMPDVQARIYAEIVMKAKQPDAGPMLETLHLLRGISLHPIWPPAGEIPDAQAYIASSARLQETFDILDEIAAKHEKALIFLESLDLQHHLALLIKNRYKLNHLPMQINGDVGGERRQKLVDEFQARRGVFDVMILSPRAGGVGLTLTSANHVIHLSRWWNPAVEDQCTDRIYRIGQDQTVHVYCPMAIHPVYGESSFDELLHSLLERKRNLSRRMLLPPVNLAEDQSWFADKLGRIPVAVELADIGDIDGMEPTAFERWVLGRPAALGWEVSRTPRSYDGGADGLLLHRPSGARAIVQCKHKQSGDASCGQEAIDDLLRAQQNYGEGARLFALTNAKGFSRTAQERAARHGICLIARDELPHWPRHLGS